MAFHADDFLKKMLGEDFFESLAKVELWKPGTRTTVDHEEVKTALQIVPRVLMAVLVRELSSMEVGQTREIHIPVPTVPALIRVTKHERDVYSGEIEHENKKVLDFKYRSIPGIGLVIMSAFELYDMENLINSSTSEESPLLDDAHQKVQKIIDERLALHDLVNKVVDKRIQERDAIQALLLQKMTDNLSKPKTTVLEKGHTVESKKNSPLKEFLEKRKKKNEFTVQMAKGETVDCPDCGKNIFDGNLFSGCVCLGEDMDSKVYIKKTETGIKVRFGKGWDIENMEMLLETLRRKHAK